jgi:hypothetical protein
MEMEKATKEAEAAHIPGGVWVWLPDRRCLVGQAVAASYREKNPLPESLQPPCNSPPCESPQRESFEGDGTRQHDGLRRSLSQDEIQQRNASSCSEKVCSPTVRIATPETPSAAAMTRKRKRRDDERQWGIKSDIQEHPDRDGMDPANDPCAHCEHMVCVCVQPPCNSQPFACNRDCGEQDDEVDHYETDYYGHNGYE